MCELDGISSLFDEHSGSDLSADDESQSDDDRESARSESNSDNGNTESSLSDSERADDKNKCELDGISSLFDERRGSDFSADDESDGDDDLESTKSELNIELCSSDSESTDDNTKATTTEPELSDDSLCEVDGFSSHFDQHGGSQLGDDDQLARDDGKALDNEDADVVINYDLQSCVDEDPLCLWDGLSTLFDESRGSESGDFSDAEERSVGLLVENEAEDKQVPNGRSTAGKSHWETAVKSFRIVAGVAGVGLALYAAYKYFKRKFGLLTELIM